MGKLLAQAGEETTVFILSDHGFGGGKIRRRFYINSWLSSLGLFYPRENPSRSLTRYLARKLRRTSPSSEEDPEQISRTDSGLDMDWKRTKVCYVGVKSMGLYILREPFAR